MDKKKIQNLSNIQQQLQSNVGEEEQDEEELNFENFQKRQPKESLPGVQQMQCVSVRNDGSIRLSARAHRQIEKFQSSFNQHSMRSVNNKASHTDRFKHMKSNILHAEPPVLSDRPAGNIVTSLVENNTLLDDEKLNEEIANVTNQKDSVVASGVTPELNSGEQQDGTRSLPSGLDEEDVNRRNFYLTLFRIYSDLPFDDCMTSLSNIYNDVFTYERPTTVQKYFLTEVQLVEMKESLDEEPAQHGKTHTVPFRYNFSSGTSKELNYLNVPEYHQFLNKAVRQIKRSDLALGPRIDLHKRGRKA